MSARAAFVSLDALTQAAPEWADLCARACEANPFAEPAFLLPLIAYEKPRVRFVLVREHGRLIGFAALRVPFAGLARLWMSPYAALPACAFDAERASAAAGALLTLLRGRRGLAGVVFGWVETGGPLSGALRAAGAPVTVMAATRRVAFRPAGVAAFEAGLKPNRRRHWGRLARKLAAQGKLEERAGADEIEAFLQVEPRGWKGARGTALADDPARLAFARAALGAFAQAGRLDAVSLRLDGAPIAAGLAIFAGARGFYWKSAYDEAFAETSPGVQLALAQSRRLAASELTVVDSCAGEDHPMIGRVWDERLAFEDWAVRLRGPLTPWLALDGARICARALAKRLLRR